jgi:diacylglycerol O-acyltransferase
MSPHRMSNADAAWLHMDRPTNLMVVNALMWFEETVDFERAREITRVRLVERFPRFRQRIAEPRLGIGAPTWEDDPDFDLDLHMHRRALPAPGDQAALQALVEDLMVRPLDRSRPMWDAYYIEGYGSGMAVLSRIHHCIADGIALAKVLMSLTDERADAGLAPPQAAAGGPGGLLDALVAPARASAHAAGIAVHEGFDIAAHPRSALPGLIGRTVDDGRALAKAFLTGADAETVLRGDPGVARRVRWTEPIDLGEVKATGHATHTTLNDVVLAAMTGALHRYLAARGSVVEQIRAMVPFNLRPLEQPLTRDLGNRFGVVLLPLPVGIANPAERLREVHRSMAAIKRSPEGPLSYGILGLIGTTPLQLEQRLMDFFNSKATAVMTNVPGPQRTVYFAGAPVAGVLSWVPASGSIGLGVSIFSYAGAMTVGLQTATALIPDPEAILQAFGEELAELERLARTPDAAGTS